MGAPGTGKSATLKMELEAIAARSPRPWAILIDPDNEYGAHANALAADLKTITSISLQAPANGAQLGAGWFRFVPSEDRDIGVKQFSYLCALAWIWATRLKREVVFLVDELAEFTKATYAPPAWRRLVKRGRKQGISIMAASQFPADIDTTIRSSASRTRVFAVAYDGHQTAAAASVGAPREEVAALTGHNFIERDRVGGGDLTRGTLHFTT